MSCVFWLHSSVRLCCVVKTVVQCCPVLFNVVQCCVDQCCPVCVSCGQFFKSSLKLLSLLGPNPPIASIISFQSSKSNFCFNSFWFRVFDRKRLLNKRPDFAVASSFKPEQILAEQASFLLRILVYSRPNVKDFQKLIQKFRTCNLSSNLNHLPSTILCQEVWGG